MSVGCLDTDALLALFSKVAGRKLLGVVDGRGCVELVFEDTGGGNLVTLYTDYGVHTGTVALGSVIDPKIYVEACGWRDVA
jgi:hypothetical protein